jgi:hypothetical protein
MAALAALAASLTEGALWLWFWLTFCLGCGCWALGAILLWQALNARAMADYWARLGPWGLRPRRDR